MIVSEKHVTAIAPAMINSEIISGLSVRGLYTLPQSYLGEICPLYPVPIPSVNPPSPAPAVLIGGTVAPPPPTPQPSHTFPSQLFPWHRMQSSPILVVGHAWMWPCFPSDLAQYTVGFFHQIGLILTLNWADFAALIGQSGRRRVWLLFQCYADLTHIQQSVVRQMGINGHSQRIQRSGKAIYVDYGG